MNGNAQRGVSLIELMISTVIALFLLGALGSVYLSSKDTYRTSEAVSRLQDNARFALRIVSDDLQLAGFLGNSTNPALIGGRKGSADQLATIVASPPALDDCANHWYVDMSSMLLVGNDAPPVINGVSLSTTCLQGKNITAGTDVIGIKHAARGSIAQDETTGALVNPLDHGDWTLIRTDPMRGQLFIGGMPEPSGLAMDATTNRRWLAHVYFISANDEGIPGLKRLALGSGPAFYNKGELVPGIQDLQIQLGVDTDGDGLPNRFVEPGMATQNQTVAARIWVLAQSETREPGYDDSVNTYVYANKRYIPGDPSTDNETEPPENPTQYRRLLLSTTVSLRNL